MEATGGRDGEGCSGERQIDRLPPRTIARRWWMPQAATDTEDEHGPVHCAPPASRRALPRSGSRHGCRAAQASQSSQRAPVRSDHPGRGGNAATGARTHSEPMPDQKLAPGARTVRGVAWSGAAPIERVEVAVGSAPWVQARLSRLESPGLRPQRDSRGVVTGGALRSLVSHVERDQHPRADSTARPSKARSLSQGHLHQVLTSNKAF